MLGSVHVKCACVCALYRHYIDRRYPPLKRQRGATRARIILKRLSNGFPLSLQPSSHRVPSAPMGQATSAALSELTSQEVAEFLAEKHEFACYGDAVVAHQLDGTVCAALQDDAEMLVLVLDALLVPEEQRAALVQHMQSFSHLISAPVHNGGFKDKHSRKHTDNTLALTPRSSGVHSGAVTCLPSSELWSNSSIEVWPRLLYPHCVLLCAQRVC
jgi:hypothetical protein